MFERTSSLAGRLDTGGRDGAEGGRRLRIGEVRGTSLVQVGTWPAVRAACTAAVVRVCGCEPPASPRLATDRGAHRLYRIAPDQLWIATHDPGLPATLEREIGATGGAVTVLTDARVRLAIDGVAAKALLSRLVPLDLRDASFPVGSFAQTGVHHAPAVLDRVGAARYDLYVLTTYAVSTWEWTLDQALPFGYDVVVADAADRSRPPTSTTRDLP
jgi:sarcosine oxidase subunit gamma